MSPDVTLDLRPAPTGHRADAGDAVTVRVTLRPEDAVDERTLEAQLRRCLARRRALRQARREQAVARARRARDAEDLQTLWAAGLAHPR